MGTMRQTTGKQKSDSRRAALNPPLPAGAARLWRAGALAYLVSALLVWGVLLALWLGGHGERDRSGDVLGPDFSAFYTAGWMLRHGEAARLYDFGRQQEVQRSLGLAPRPPAQLLPQDSHNWWKGKPATTRSRDICPAAQGLPRHMVVAVSGAHALDALIAQAAASGGKQRRGQSDKPAAAASP